MGNIYSFQKNKKNYPKSINEYHSIKGSQPIRLKKRTNCLCGGPIRKKYLIRREAHDDLFDSVNK